MFKINGIEVNKKNIIPTIDKIDNEKNFGDNNALSLFVNMWVVAINPNINPKGISKYTKQKVEIKANKIASGTHTKVTSWS